MATGDSPAALVLRDAFAAVEDDIGERSSG